VLLSHKYPQPNVKLPILDQQGLLNVLLDYELVRLDEAGLLGLLLGLRNLVATCGRVAALGGDGNLAKGIASRPIAFSIIIFFMSSSLLKI